MVNVGLGKVGYMEGSGWLGWAVRDGGGVQEGALVEKDQGGRGERGCCKFFLNNAQDWHESSPLPSNH
jgi:hypothetical protein